MYLNLISSNFNACDELSFIIAEGRFEESAGSLFADINDWYEMLVSNNRHIAYEVVDGDDRWELLCWYN